MSQTEQTKHNALSWVKSELDDLIKHVRLQVNAHLENDQPDALVNALAVSQQVLGTLRMVEQYGATLLTEEVIKLLEALIAEKINDREAAFEVLLSSILQLPDYLERIEAGHQDVPMVLLPLMNDMRAARGAELMSESVLFLPDLHKSQPAVESIEISGVSSQQEAKKLRQAYQLGLLTWFRKKDTDAGIKSVNSVLAKLHDVSYDVSARSLWWIANAVAEAVLDMGLDANSVAVKSLMGRVDRQIKTLIDGGEDAFAQQIPSDLVKNLLYYVATAKSTGAVVTQVKQTYMLSDYLPGGDVFESTLSSLSGPNQDLVNTVSRAVIDDLLSIKDGLEVYAHSSRKNPDDLQQHITVLQKMGDTLGMIGLGQERDTALAQAKVLQDILDGSQSAAEALPGIASDLLEIETGIDNYVSRSRYAPSVLDRSAMPNTAEFLQVLAAVTTETLREMARIKDAILSFIAQPNDSELLVGVPTQIDQVRGALSMLPVGNLIPILNGLRDYIELSILRDGVKPGPEVLEALADAITSVEFYLEALQSNRGDYSHILDVGLASLNTLDIPSRDDELETEELSSEEDLVDLQSVDDLDEDDAVSVDVPEAKAGPVNTREPLEAITGEVDEEILDIFLEEAEEEIERIGEFLPQWMQNPQNEEALITMRRSFHTLKGSGRLVGAKLIGEYAWTHENMLNRVIDGTIHPNDGVFSVLRASLGCLPVLVKQVRGEVDPSTQAYELMDLADAVAQGEYVSAADLEESEADLNAFIADDDEPMLDEEANASFAAFMSDEAEPIADDGINIEEVDDTYLVDHEIHMSAADTDAAPEIELEYLDQLDLGDEDVSDDAQKEMPEIETTSPDANATSIMAGAALDQLRSEHAEEAVEDDVLEEITLEAFESSLFGSEDDEAAEPRIDPVLFDIFVAESEQHLKTLGGLCEGHANELPVNLELLRALHTLNGSARTAEVPEISDVFAPLEALAKDYSAEGVPLGASIVTIIRDATVHVRQVLLALGDKRLDVPNGQQLKTRVEHAPRPEVGQTAQDSGKDEEPLAAALSEFHAAFGDAETDAVNDVEAEEPEAIVLAEPADESNVAEISEEPAEPDPQPVEVETAASGLEQMGVEPDLPAEQDADLIEIFCEEAREILDATDGTLHQWAQNHDDQDAINELQRHMHTLKGGARMAGMGNIGDLSHAFESLVTSVVEGDLPLGEDVFVHLNRALDELSSMVDQVLAGQPIYPRTEQIGLLERFRHGGNTEQVPLDERIDAAVEEAREVEVAEDVVELVEEEPVDLVIEDEGGIELVEEAEEDAWASFAEDDGIEVIEVETGDSFDELSVSQDSMDDELVVGVEAAPVEEVLPVSDEEVMVAAESVPLSSFTESTETPAVADKSAASPTPQSAEDSNPAAANRPSIADQVRVRSDLLDNLVNYAGEANIYHARIGQEVTGFGYNLNELNQTVSRLKEQLRKLELETEAQVRANYEQQMREQNQEVDDDFDPLEMDEYSTIQQLSRALAESVNDLTSIETTLTEQVRDTETLLLQQSRVSTDLQEGLMRTRMVQFGGIAPRLRRIVRQTADELGKKVSLDITGEQSELDRSVLDRMVAPLEHMLRNSIAHGIESPEERARSGKPEQGKIQLSVHREGAEVVLDVEDDGQGLSVSRIREKIAQRGLHENPSSLNDESVIGFILESGFSTAENISQIAGRGVGMDVVNSEIKQLGGNLSIQSEEGKGARFTVGLPFTLAINQALLVQTGDDLFAVPLDSIEGIVRASAEELREKYAQEKPLLEYATGEYELSYLGQLLNLHQVPIHEDDTGLYPVLLITAGERRIALQIDSLLGSREVVVKSVGPQISKVRGVAGATILGDGRVVLILDVSNLARLRSSGTLERVESVSAVADTPVVEHVPTVMVVDDSITIRKVTTRILERNDYQVMTAKDGVDAVAQLQENLPDIMLLDIEMPRMDGYELATHIRNDSRLKHIPIIMITSRTGDKHRQRAMDIGVNRYLGKPYQETDLLDNIQTILAG